MGVRGGKAPRQPRKVLKQVIFLIFQAMGWGCRWEDKIVCGVDRRGTMIQKKKNAAGWWSSFVCSSSMAPFREDLRFPFWGVPPRWGPNLGRDPAPCFQRQREVI